jgi:hypothetical protein
MEKDLSGIWERQRTAASAGPVHATTLFVISGSIPTAATMRCASVCKNPGRKYKRPYPRGAWFGVDEGGEMATETARLLDAP